jgi:hypothetical protein
MAYKSKIYQGPTALNDPENVLMVEVTPPEEKGMSPENAYRHLAGLPPEPVDVPEEI